jgi:hypothetical protein
MHVDRVREVPKEDDVEQRPDGNTLGRFREMIAVFSGLFGFREHCQPIMNSSLRASPEAVSTHSETAFHTSTNDHARPGTPRAASKSCSRVNSLSVMAFSSIGRPV